VARETWKSRFSFIMATAGFAVGLGNIWRFPYMAGENGGGAFLIVYLAFTILIGIPLLTAEISMGRKTQLSPIAGMRELTGSATHPWNLIGWMGVATAVVIHALYIMIVAWIVGYFGMMIGGRLGEGSPADFQAVYDGFISNMPLVLGLIGAILVALGAILTRGLTNGLERVAKFAMPLLFAMLLVLVVRSVTLPGGGEGLIWYL
jgi:NSS family neurotransmitter:Na+ symporter